MHEVPIEFHAHCVDGCDCDLPGVVEDAVFRVVQEALHNALRHAEAARVRVEVRVGRDRVVAEIADDGVGFVGGRDGGHHLGIMSMRERARRAGGRFGVTSRPGAGTTARLEVPRG